MVVNMNKTENALVLMEKDAIKKDQDGIKTALGKLDLRIHKNAVQCLMHAEQHGDTSLMRRLLVDIIDAKSGYRRQGLIQWVRLYSPMELKGDTINLSGVDDKGNKRPFLVSKAHENPFWTITALREIVRPVFQAGIVAKFQSGIRDFDKAMANTHNGKAIDVTKPFYDGVQPEIVSETLKKIAELVATLPADKTRDIRAAQETVLKSGMSQEDIKQVFSTIVSEAAETPEDEDEDDAPEEQAAVA